MGRRQWSWTAALVNVTRHSGRFQKLVRIFKQNFAITSAPIGATTTMSSTAMGRLIGQLGARFAGVAINLPSVENQ